MHGDRAIDTQQYDKADKFWSGRNQINGIGLRQNIKQGTRRNHEQIKRQPYQCWHAQFAAHQIIDGIRPEYPYRRP